MVSEKERARRNAKRNEKRKKKRLQKQVVETKIEWFNDQTIKEEEAKNKKIAVEWRLPNR